MMHRKTSGRRRWSLRAAGLLALGACVAGANPARAQYRVRPLKIDEVIDRSESIFVAVCESRRTDVRRGTQPGTNFVTVYRMRLTEVWKGSVDVDAKQAFTMEELGGSPDGQLGIVQVVPSMVNLAEGEEVVLFTRNYKSDPAKEALGIAPLFAENNPMVVDAAMGRYTVVTDPESGEKFAAARQTGERGSYAIQAATRAGQLNRLQNQLKQWKERQEAQGLTQAKPVTGDEIRPPSFEKLSAMRERVMERVRLQAAEASRGENR
jgi:hypothetical protein